MKTETKKRVGDIEIIKRVRQWRCCKECGLPARYKITFLLPNARINPDSSAYQHDDCSWCSDLEIYACEMHHDIIRQNPPEGYRWCAEFLLKKFLHMGFYWKEIER